MRNVGFAVLAVAVLTAGVRAAGAKNPAEQSHSRPTPKPAASHGPALVPADAQNKLVAANCATCHDDDAKTGGISLEHFDAAAIERNPALAEKIIRKLRAGMMPPPSV